MQPQVSQLVASASSHQRSGRAEAAIRDLEQAVALDPNQPAALNSLGMLALEGGDHQRAAELFRRAAAADPAAPALWLNLAKAQRLLADVEGERNSLRQVLELDQTHLTGLIRMAELHERLGEEGQAVQRWSGVLAIGQRLDQRSSDLDALLGHASAYVAERMRVFSELVDRGLAAEREATEPTARRRFEAAVDASLGRRRIYSNQCAGLHYPFLPADEFFDREHFPWMPALEAQSDAIREELKGLLESGQQGFRPYVKMDPGTPQNKWTDLDHSMRWGAYFLWEFGTRCEEACARCPVTAAALEAIPRADIPGRAPSAFFSLLRPGTRIPPHTGVTNSRTIIHLPLIVPDGCGFRVGGETRTWKVGEAFAFDDTIEHEAWNDSEELRAVLIFDVWNPHLSEAETALLKTFYSVSDASGYNPEPRGGL